MQKINNTTEITLLESWFNHRVIKPQATTPQQTIAGWLGIINGSCSSVVNFPLGFAFGYTLAQHFHFSHLSALLVGTYFGITATIPLLFLASYTSYCVLHNIFMPLLPAERIWRHKRTPNVVEGLLWGFALLSSIPFLYVTHITLFPLIQHWVYFIDFSAVTAPTIVNSWALRNAGKELKNLFELLYLYLKKCPAENLLAMRHSLRKNFLIASQSVERISKPHMMSIYASIFCSKPTGADNPHPFHYILALTQSRYNQVPRWKVAFGCLGAMIGAISAFQYLGNGKAAADWLHVPQLANLIGFAGLICNSALGGYTGKIVFEEFYNWLGFMREWITHDQEPAIAPASITPEQTLLSWLKNGGILLVAISAATPNVYLTLMQQTDPHSILNLIWLSCSFIGPLATNIYALSSTLNQKDKRARLKEIIAQVLDVISQLPETHTKTLYQQLQQLKTSESSPV